MNKKPKLYTKEPNGRYKEYVEIEPKYDNALYRRVGKRYEPVSMADTCSALPEGIWVVMRNKYYLQTANSDYLRKVFKLEKTGDIEEMPLSKIGGMTKLGNYLAENWEKVTGDTQYERCYSIVKILFDYEKQNKE
jgi:hypothetical protein